MNKYYLLLVLISTTLLYTNCTGKNNPKQTATNSDTVSFIVTVDSTNATKDGIYLNGYVVNLDSEQINKLHGKKIRVTGKVTIVKGIANLPGGEMNQGREGDTKHIISPKIEILEG